MSAIIGLPAARWVVSLVILAMGLVAWAAPRAAEAAPFHGAIYTTTDACTTVNENVGYTSKLDVFLNGGPQGGSPRGLPDGNYWVRVTEPNGTVLGESTSANATVSGGVLDCDRLWDLVMKESDGSQGYDDTSNNGGEYKAWLCQTNAFSPSSCKTDNFKVREEAPTPVDACAPAPNRIVVFFGGEQLIMSSTQFIEETGLNIPAGTYSVTLRSFDDHSGDDPPQDQDFEQWSVRFGTAGGPESGVISDLPDNLDELTENVGEVELLTDITSLRAVHALSGQGPTGPESVTPVCVALDRVDD
ncbi:MAG: hypothetical protein GEU80_01535 [Dehalococcoidia bacterium]|nr:hypothetical protein [Dehalococcoidia bacterium]